MDVRLAVHLGRGRLQYPRARAACQHEHVEGSHHVGFDGLDGIVLVVNWRGGAGQVIDLVDLQQQRLADVVPQKLEAAVIEQMSDVISTPREKVIEADDFVALQNQTFTEMRADEPRTARHEHLHCITVVLYYTRRLTPCCCGG
jgi:hypothetical protein